MLMWSFGVLAQGTGTHGPQRRGPLKSEEFLVFWGPTSGLLGTAHVRGGGVGLSDLPQTNLEVGLENLPLELDPLGSSGLSGFLWTLWVPLDPLGSSVGSMAICGIIPRSAHSVGLGVWGSLRIRHLGQGRNLSNLRRFAAKLLKVVGHFAALEVAWSAWAAMSKSWACFEDVSM